jgi:hypothetical protein
VNLGILRRLCGHPRLVNRIFTASRPRVLGPGSGLRRSPYRYWLPEQEAAWTDDPLAALFMPELFQMLGRGTTGP